MALHDSLIYKKMKQFGKCLVTVSLLVLSVLLIILSFFCIIYGVSISSIFFSVLGIIGLIFTISLTVFAIERFLFGNYYEI